MSLKKYYQQLMDIKETSGSNEKILKLKEFLKDENAVKILELMYDDSYHFGINKMAPFKRTLFSSDAAHIFRILTDLSTQRGTSNQDKIALSQAASIDRETYDLVSLIVNKDAKCGFSNKTINKARPDTVFIAPYCRCSTSSKLENIAFPAISQEKADGVFVNLLIDNSSVHNLHFEFRTRNWKRIWQIDHLKTFFNTVKESIVIHGELLVVKNGKVLDRSTGNGIIYSCINGTALQEDVECIVMRVWDCMPYVDFFNNKCTIPYINRLSRLRKIVKEIHSPFVKLVETEHVNSMEQAMDFYSRMRKMGKEGAVLKNRSAIWKFHTSVDMIKMKNVSVAELRIVKWKKGEPGTKYENCMGAVLCSSEEGKIQVWLGSGFSDDQRLINWNEYIGYVVSAEFDSITQNKKTGVYSLYLASFVDLRLDRTSADTYMDIINRSENKLKDPSVKYAGRRKASV